MKISLLLQAREVSQLETRSQRGAIDVRDVEDRKNGAIHERH